MGFWQRLFSRKADRPQVAWSFHNTGQPQSWARSYDNFAKEGYQNCVIAYRCIQMIATACAGIPWELYTKGRKNRTEIESHPLLDLLDHPNPLQYGTAFVEAMVAYREISGNSFVLSVGNLTSMRPPTELWTLNPEYMKIIPGSKTGIPKAFRYGTGSDYVDYPVDSMSSASDILHMKNFHPRDPWYGMSPIEAAAFSIDQHNASGKWNAALLQNSATPSGALVLQLTDQNPSGELSTEQEANLRFEIDQRFSGPKNAGRPMLLMGGLDWKQMSLSPKQMDWVESKSTSARDICFAFGVPSMLVGIPGDNTYANYKEARMAFYEEKILPLMDALEKELNGFLAPRYGDKIELGYNKDEIEALSPKRDALWERINAATDLTVNEKRCARGYEELDPEDGGDSILVNTTQTTLEALEKAAQEPTDAQEEMTEDGGDDQTTDYEDYDEEPRDLSLADEPRNDGKELKFFNHTSKAAQRREWKRHDRIKQRFIGKMRMQVSALFKVEGQLVAHAMRGQSLHHDQMAASNLISSHAKSWRPILERNIKAVSKTFGYGVLKQAKDLKGRKSGWEFKDAQSKFDSFLQNWINTHMGEKITNLEETTKDKILKAIRDAYAENLDEQTGSDGEPLGDESGFVDSLASKIEDTYSMFSKSRARLIARTEIGTAASQASFKAADATGLDLMKQWVPRSGVTNHRADHEEMIGSEPIPMHEKFIVGGEEMAHTGDPAGGPAQICNCECITLYIPTDTSQDDGTGSDTGDEGEGE